MNKRRGTAWLAILVALVLVAAACGDDDDGDTGSGDSSSEDGGGEALSGRIEIDGSSTVGPLTEAAAEFFQEENPDVEVTVGVSGTGGGFERFCIGETDANDASRPIDDEEIEICDENGVEYEQVTVANDALSLVVNPDNGLDCISVDQANQIWDQGSTVSSWSDVDGLEGAPDGDITLYGPGTDSGTFDFFTEVINGEEGVIRTDFIDIGEDDQAAIEGVQGDVGSMAYIPFSFVSLAGDSVKPLQIDDGNGCVEASLEEVQAGNYTPLGRPIFLYPSAEALQRAEMVAFMEFYINNSDAIAEAATFIPLTDEQKEEQLEVVAGLAG